MRIDIKVVTICYTILLGYEVYAATDVCITNGTLSTTDLWHGYLFEHTLHENHSILSYQISYPASQCCAKILLYHDDQIANITQNMNCEQREAILSPSNNQIIYLEHHYLGCEITVTGIDQYMCIGERYFQSSKPRTWYAAVSRCDSNNDTLTMEYFFNMTNVVGSCDEGISTGAPPQTSNITNSTANYQTTSTSNVKSGPVYSSIMMITCALLLIILYMSQFM